mgnify:CR=1 FL=1
MPPMIFIAEALRGSDSQMEFDLELAKSESKDNPVYYIQYAHARVCSVLRKLDEAGKRAADADPLPVLLEHPTLIKRPVITDGEEILDVGFDPESLEDYI